jgi:hypothetical protein
MPGAATRVTERRNRRGELAGWPVGIVSYRLHDHYVCEIDNVSPGTRIALGEGETRQKAEAHALAIAERMLTHARRRPMI